MWDSPGERFGGNGMKEGYVFSKIATGTRGRHRRVPNIKNCLKGRGIATGHRNFASMLASGRESCAK